MADDHATSQRSDQLASAIKAVKQNPKDRARWDRVEELLETEQRPNEVSELFRHVIAKGVSAELMAELGQRGLRFYETWFGEDSDELRDWLERVLAAEPQAQWAFERLTVAYTVAERWSPLLDAYDRAIAAADQTSRRMRLLEEAAQVAKDFASLPERAIGYMLKLHALDPDNSTLAHALERLLERQERWEDLVGLWQSRLTLQSPKQARESRVRIAGCYLDKLGRHREALEQAKLVLQDAPEHEATFDLVERVLSSERAGAAERREALALLKQRFLEAREPEQVVRVLELGLGYAKDAERRGLLRELVERLIELGEQGRAMKHQAELLALEPVPRERDALRVLCERTRDHALFARALVAAADRAEQAATACELLLEAARTYEDVLGDEARAGELYRRVFNADAPAELVADAGRRLVPLLEQVGNEKETLEALARLSELERAPQARRLLLGRIARLSEKLGDRARADQAWQTRLRDDGDDIEALDALVASASEQQQWTRLAILLEQRIKAPGASQRRRQDLVWLAATHGDKLGDPDAAIEVWRRIQAGFGEDTESVAALTDLLARAERWRELADVLSQAATRQIERFTELQTRLGDAYRERLDQPELAAQRYASALSVDARDGSALRGQQALLNDARGRAVAVKSLCDAYARTNEWKKTLELLEPRLELESSVAAQAEILREAAQLHERGADPRAALGCLRRAFALAPDDRQTEKEIRRLAESLGAWDAVIAAYRETIASFVRPTPRVAELRFDEARTLEERLHDKEAALGSYVEACAIAPERVDLATAAVRVACELGEFERAAQQLLTCAAARGALVPELLASFEAAAAAARAWDRVAEAFTRAIGAASGLAPALVRDLHARVAHWHRTLRKDEDAAEASLVRAMRADAKDPELLRALADIQRRAPGAPLCDTLLALSELERENLDPLLEAASVARDAMSDGARKRAIWQQLYDRAADLLRAGRDASGEASAAYCARFALDQLALALSQAGEHARALGLLQNAASLPFDAEDKRADLHRAARVAQQDLKDAARAIVLYRDLLHGDPTDRVALRELCTLYQANDMLPELLALKRHELTLERDQDKKLGLRLEVAAILGELEARGGRRQSLEENLRARPGHAPTLAALETLLAGQGKHAEHAELLRREGHALAERGEPDRAAELLQRAAGLYERELADTDKAIQSYRDLHQLDPAGAASAALARLYGKEGQHAEAAKWLELRLGTAPPDTRAVTSVELARALLEAGERQRARARLEQALREDSSLNDARGLLGEIYREDEAFEALAELLCEAANHEPDPARQLSLLREASDLYIDRLHTPERAVSALERAAALAPDDRALSSKLAEAFSACGRARDARRVLERMVEAFGRKRSPERAELHFRLARVAKVENDTARAFEELDTATKMDPGHASAMHMLAELAREQGDLERAERTYRGLLMLVRRQKPGEALSVGPSEIFHALSAIAGAHGAPDKAAELLESAMEAATQNDAEARRFQELLRKRGEHALLMRLLDARQKRVEEPAALAEILATKASVLAETPKKRGEALDALLEAVALAPDSDGLHAQARGLAKQLDDLDRYLERVSTLAEEAQRKKDEASQRMGARLTLRLGAAIEQELSDLDRAAGLYAKVESSGHEVVEAWMAMARVAGARGDQGEQRRVLQHIAELGPERISAEQRRTAAFALLELELAHDAWRDAGADSLERLLEGLTDFERPKALLRLALEQAPGHAKLEQLFERVARASRDHTMLLEHIERRASRPDARFADLREGIELALRIGEHARAEALLQRARGLTVGPDSRADRTWVLSRLADCRKRAGDIKSAIAELREAAESADPEEAEPLFRHLAELATSPAGDLEVAASAYTRLLERDPTDRELWLPLLEVYRKLRDRSRFEGFAEQCLRDLISPADRAAVQMARAKFLLEVVQDERAAVPILKALLEDEPGQAEATRLLTEILQRHGMHEELAELLQVHFDRARDEQNLEAIAELGMRIGELYAERRPEAAVDVYRAALQWVPDHRGLLQALLEALGPDAEARERAEVMQSLLRLAEGQEAARLALQLASIWGELDEPERVQQVLELGQKATPDHDGLRDKLESFYAGREEWRPLAQLLEREAERLGKTGQAVARLKNAASIYREQLKDLEAASATLRKALVVTPDDLSLLGELARNLAASGEHVTAIADVTRLLDAHPDPNPVRVDLLKVRAELRLETEQLEGAVADLEAAYAIAPEAARHQLIDALERWKTAAFTRGESAAERGAVMRLAALHDAGSDPDAAREVLAGWVEQTPDDAEALRALRQRDLARGRFEDVIRSCERLLDVETGDARVATAVALADACEKVGRPEAARDGLERAYHTEPGAAQLRARLRRLYAAISARAELAAFLLEDARATKDAGERVALLQQAARLFIELGDAGSALGPLGEAVKLQPDDMQSQLLLIDIAVQQRRFDEAHKALESAIATQRRKRSPELAALYQRMARLSAAQNDHEEQLKWLNQAIEIDRKSGEIAAELADAALAVANYDVAMKALRAITMMDDPKPMSRAMAFLQQARIAHLRGDPRRAQHWARKAKSLDEGLSDADVFLAEIEA